MQKKPKLLPTKQRKVIRLIIAIKRKGYQGCARSHTATCHIPVLPLDTLWLIGID
jgi:hypothetical protein